MTQQRHPQQQNRSEAGNEQIQPVECQQHSRSYKPISRKDNTSRDYHTNTPKLTHCIKLMLI
jgi:hypothetical protein